MNDIAFCFGGLHRHLTGRTRPRWFGFGRLVHADYGCRCRRLDNYGCLRSVQTITQKRPLIPRVARKGQCSSDEYGLIVLLRNERPVFYRNFCFGRFTSLWNGRRVEFHCVIRRRQTSQYTVPLSAMGNSV